MQLLDAVKPAGAQFDKTTVNYKLLISVRAFTTGEHGLNAPPTTSEAKATTAVTAAPMTAAPGLSARMTITPMNSAVYISNNMVFDAFCYAPISKMFEASCPHFSNKKNITLTTQRYFLFLTQQ